MMNIKKNLILAFAAISIGLSSPVMAQSSGETSTESAAPSSGGSGVSMSYEGVGDNKTCCGRYYDHGHANGNAKAVIGNIRQSIAALQLAIIEAMRLGTGQLSGNLREQSGADHNLADQQDDRQVVQATEQVRMEAIAQSANGVTTCKMILSAKGAAIETVADEIKIALTSDIGDYLKGEAGPATQGPSYAMQAQLQVHCDFASKTDVDLGVCSEVNEEYKDADINAGRGLFHTNKDGTSGYDEDRAKGATAFVNNIVVRQTLTPFDTSKANTPEGREELQIRNNYLSKQSLATEALAQIRARRHPVKDKEMVAWASGTAKNMANFKNADFSEGINLHDYMKMKTQSFMYDQTTLGTSDRDMVTAIKEIKNIAAVQSGIQFEQYAILEKISALLAAQLAIVNDNTRKDLIIR